MRKLLYLFIVLCFSSTVLANENKPRLTVFISVDGLRSEYLSELLPHLDNNGIKKLFTSGTHTFSANTRFKNNGKATHYASMMTGSTPSNHGIIADKFYSHFDNDVIYALTDNRYQGINTNENISPRNLMATTIADEIKLKDNSSKVFSIALDPQSAIMFGGHIADASIWIDDETGMIATSHFYNKGIPDWAAKLNNENTVALNSTKQWKPSQNLVLYSRPAITQRQVFSEDPIFHQTKPDAVTYEKTTALKTTPFVNNIIKDLAIRALRDERMGTDDATDLLCVEFSAKTKFDQNGLCAEIEDMYLNLDENIKYLLDAIEISVGLDNVLVVFTGYNAETYSPELLKSKRISSGTFNAERSMALLNAYLMAIYGQGKWVSGYYARNIYLNRSLIEENKVKMSEIQELTAQFMLEFTGVHSSISAYQLKYLSINDGDDASRTKLSHFKNRSGDVMFNLLPGWYEIDDNENFIGQTSRRQNAFPIAIMGYKIDNKNININIEDIIPTICSIINTPEPNACSGEKKELINN